MAIQGGWTPLSGPKVPAESTDPSPLSSPITAEGGLSPVQLIPSRVDDGFTRENCCAVISKCRSGACTEEKAVNVASGALLYRFTIPDNTIPLQIAYESDQPGAAALGSKGWVSNLHRKIDVSPSMVTVTCSDGGKVDYTQDPTSSFTYYPSSGIDNLVQQNSSQTNLYTETLPNGLQFQYDTQLTATGRLTNLIDPDGRRWTLGYTGTTLGYLQNHRSRRVTFHYDSGGSKVVALEDTAARKTTFAYDGSNRVMSITGPQGCVRAFEYDGLTQRISRISNPDNYYSLITYSSGQVQTVRAVNAEDPSKDQIVTYNYSTGETGVTNPEGSLTSYTFDVTMKYLTRLRDAEGNITTFNWDSAVRVSTVVDPRVVDPRGVTTQYLWEKLTTAANETRRRLKAHNPASSGYYTTLSYTGQNYEIQSVVNPRGYQTTFTYLNRHLRSIKNALNEITTWNYSANVLSSVQDPLSYRTTFVFASNGMLESKTDPELHKTTFGYDAAANRTLIVDALNYRTTHSYDAANRLTAVQDSEGNIKTFTYSAGGLLTSKTDPRGSITTYVYNSTGQRISVVDELSKTTTYSYDRALRVIRRTNPLVKSTTYTYDKVGRLLGILDALGQRSTYTYDGNSNRVSLKRPTGATTTWSYDDLNRVTAEINPLDYRVTYSYDRSRNVIKVKDANGHALEIGYDALGRVNQAITAQDPTVTFSYNAYGQLGLAIDGNGQRTTFSYSKTGRLIEEQDPLGYRTTLVYNAVNSVIARVDADNTRTTLSYDKVRRITKVQYGSANSGTMTYDASGNLVGILDATGFLSMTYDRRNLLLTRKRGAESTMTYSYDDARNRISRADEDGTDSYTYDNLNRVSTVDASGPITTISYDGWGHVERVEHPNGVKTVYSYDVAGRLNAIETSTTTLVLSRLDYTVDRTGRVVEVVGSGVRTTYSYDSDSRLIREHRSDPTLAGFDITYAYDSAGNRIKKTENGATTTYTLDARGALKKVQDGSGIVTYQYSKSGNRTAKIKSSGTTTYSYDARGGLVRIDTPVASPHITYSYDISGQCIGYTKNSVIVTEMWDHASLLCRKEGGAKTRYTIAPSDLIGAALSQVEAGQSKVLLPDNVGSIVNLVDSSRATVGTLVLDAFGAFRAKSGAVSSVLRFVGRYQYLTDLQGESAGDEQLIHVRDRHYDPVVGSFLQPDPIGRWADKWNLGNAYGYVQNDPLTRIDPLGWQGLGIPVQLNVADMFKAPEGEDKPLLECKLSPVFTPDPNVGTGGGGRDINDPLLGGKGELGLNLPCVRFFIFTQTTDFSRPLSSPSAGIGLLFQTPFCPEQFKTRLQVSFDTNTGEQTYTCNLFELRF